MNSEFTRFIFKKSSLSLALLFVFFQSLALVGTSSTESTSGITHYFARKVILSILDDFDDAWALGHIDTEWKNGNCILRFHFAVNTEEAAVFRVQVDPALGNIVSVLGFDPLKSDEISSSSSGEIGNVEALKLFLPRSRQDGNIEEQHFRDISIVRVMKEHLDEFETVSGDELIIVRRRLSFPIPMRSEGVSCVGYDSRTGEVQIKFIGDLLKYLGLSL